MTLQEYLGTITGHKITLSAFDGHSKLPLILSGYHFYSGEILTQKYVFAHDPECRLSPHQYFKQWIELQKILETKVIFVFDALSSVNRNRLFQAGVPFIVPGCQFFLPPGINFKERGKQKIKPADKLPFPAQLLIIRELLFHDVSEIMQNEIAVKIGYSPMSIFFASEALKEKGLCELISKKKSKHIRFNFNGRELWNKSLPLMRSPVRKVYWNMQKPVQLPFAGISALSHKSMISPDQIPTFATAVQEIKVLQNFKQADCKESAQSLLEVWQYHPFAEKNRCVEPFSLYLSLKDDGDPRVAECLEEMMENIKW